MTRPPKAASHAAPSSAAGPPDSVCPDRQLHGLFGPSSSADNITVSAHGGLILAEDGDGKQHLVGATDSGETFYLARNDHPDDSEFAGPTFANIQSPGYVLAIKGPWRKQR